MPPIAYIDRVDTLEQVERLGVIRSLTRRVRVQFRDFDPRPQDFSILDAAYSAVHPGTGQAVPAAMSTLAEARYHSLVLVERQAQLVGEDPFWVDITLKYEHVIDGPNQSLNPSPAVPGLLYGKGRASIVEKTTNFYRPYGEPDLLFPNDPTVGRIQIQVAHTFPPGKSQPPTTGFDTNLPYTIVQGGEINVPFPQANFTLQGIIETADPQSETDRYIAVINKFAWQNKPALTWICSDVQWEVMDTDLIARPPSLENPMGLPKRRYKFSFEFQYNADTWDPTVTFLDQRTGRPPSGVQPATDFDPAIAAPLQVKSYRPNPYLPGPTPALQPAGYWTVPYLRRDDFNELFGFANFESV